jgi:CHAT domain-containing protein
VADAWPSAEAGSFADLASLRRRLLDADALHFAGHALAGADGSLRLVLHDDRARPFELDAPTLLADPAPRLLLVTLSGCRTVDVGAAGRVGASAAGVVRSFLAAGVPTVVGSFLDLDNGDAAPVFADFHRRAAAGEEPATALQRACLSHSFRTELDRSLMCGSLAVFGSSSPLLAGNPASGPSSEKR